MVLSFASSSPATAPAVNPLVVLLVDPDEEFRSGLAENLRDDGHEVQECTGPNEVPPLAALRRVNAVVIGQHNLQNGTLAFADAFHSQYPMVPILLITPYWSPHADRLAASHRFLQLRTKPIDYDELHALLRMGAIAVNS